jgi:hypothetical protein
MNKKDYQRPMMRVIQLQKRPKLLSVSGDANGGGKLGNSWRNSSSDAWDGTSTSDGSDMGGWTDKGGSAWQ